MVQPGASPAGSALVMPDGETHFLHAVGSDRPSRRLARRTGTLTVAPTGELQVVDGDGRPTLLRYGAMLSVDEQSGQVIDALGHVIAVLGGHVQIGGGGTDDGGFHVGSITTADADADVQDPCDGTR